MQILVVVANIQVRSLKAEVEKGSMGTAVDHGSGGPSDPVTRYREVGCRCSVNVCEVLCWQPPRSERESG